MALRQSEINPFHAGRQYRSDELGDAVVTSAHWRWTVWVLIVGGILLGCSWSVREITRSPIKVLVLQIDESGTTRIIGPLPDRYRMTEAVIKREVRTFVEALRRVLDDKVAMGMDWDEKQGLFARVTVDGRARLAQEMQARGNPLEQREPVLVEVLRILPKGPQGTRTFDVSWAEQHYSAPLSGGTPGETRRELLETSRWSGLFSYVERTPRTEAEFYANPTGIWLDQWSYSREH
jgi:type IV secretion system protein TrbF